MFHTITMDPIGFVSFLMLGILVGLLISLVIDLVAATFHVRKLRDIEARANKISDRLKEMEGK